MKKIMIGLVLAAICGVGVNAFALTGEGNKTVEVKPITNANVTQSSVKVTDIKGEIETYIISTYGENWAVDLYNKNGGEWDDILESELESKFGHNNEDIIDSIVDEKESKSGLDIDNDDDSIDDNKTTASVSKAEIEKYIVNRYGENWAIDLYNKHGEEWDDILEDELESKFGHNNDDIVDNIIDLKEKQSKLDDDNDDIYDTDHDNNDLDDADNDHDDNDLDDIDHDNDDSNDRYDD